MPVSRRTLVLAGVAASGGLGLAYLGRRLDDGDATTKFAATTPDTYALNAWVKIAPGGQVTVGVHRAEMGQGVITSLAMLVAEELDADWSTVGFEFTPVDKDYFNFGILLRGRPLGPVEDRPLAAAGTAAIRGLFRQLGMSVTISSASTVDAWDTLRDAGARARAMLVAAAARRLGVPADSLVTAAGIVTDPASGRSLPYGELAEAAARERPGAVALKAQDRFRLIGTSPHRLELPAQVRGLAAYGLDTVMPDMLYGAVRHPPRAGSRLGSFDGADAGAVPGVDRVVALGDRAVAVLARDTWSAQQGAARLVLESAPGTGATVSTGDLLASYRQDLDRPEPSVFRDDGGEDGSDVAAVPPGGTGLSSEYELPFLAHLCLEPMNCTARFADGRLTVWAPTQAPSIARDEAAKAAGLAPGQVDVRQTRLGGGFGRRAEMDFVVEAALAAMAVPGRAVKLTWSRPEDVRHDTYRPAAVGRCRGALDAGGRITGLDYTLVSESVVASNFRRTPSARGGDAAKDQSALTGAITLRYAIPKLRMAYVPRDDGIPVGFWRSVSSSINPFLVESFIDELARAAGADPLEFRRAHLAGQADALAVLDAAARLGRWGEPLAPGRGRGLSFIESHDSLVAQVVEVTVADDGALRVDRVACVVDCRTVVHPDNVVAQVTGAIQDGLWAALVGKVTFRGGVVEQGNFDDLPWLRMKQVPEITVQLLPQGGRPGGVGEPGVPGVAPALANAVFSATGRRFRSLPLGLVLPSA